MNKEEKLLQILKQKGHIIKKKGKLYLKFDFFKLFKINKIFLKKDEDDEILILKSKDKIFEYWVNQNLFIPPWQTHWFQLKYSFLLKLRGNLLKDIIHKAIENAGNLNILCKIIKFSYPTFCYFKQGKIKMISVKKLRKLLNYLEIKYSNLNKKIEYTKKGNKISIKYPKFPINLFTIEGALLLGMIVSDGCIYIDKKARNKLRTKYSSGEIESIEKFQNIINKIYGKTHIQKENVRNCDILRVGSSIIGESLIKVGAILGHKAKINGRVPWLIRYGSSNLKKAYLHSVFEDESSVYCDLKKIYNSYIILSRVRHLKNLTNNQRKILKKLNKHMKVSKFPTGHVSKRMSIKKALEKINEKDLIKDLKIAPRLLIDESFILKEMGIENRMFGRSLSKTHLGNYSLCFDLFVNKKNGLKKFYKEIGFSLPHKQNKLIKIVGGENRTKTIQHANTEIGKIQAN